MLEQNVPGVATRYAADLRSESGAAVSAALRQWRRIRGDLDRDFLRTAPQLIAIANASQLEVSRLAQAYIPEVLAATGQSRADRPSWDISERAFVGTAGDGRPTESLIYGALTHTKDAIGSGATYAEALDKGGKYLSMALGTLLSDTSRGMESFETASRPVGGWVRMLTPPSCGRCVILAGKFFTRNRGFERHPGCDCRHIPASEAIAGDMTVDTTAYLDSLDDAGLAKALGSQANATAYREHGADSRQLVNAYRAPGGRRGPKGLSGIKTAQVYGKNVKYTLEGTTVRGDANHQMRRVRQLSEMAKDGGRYRRVTAPRLMPESIMQIATSKAHAERLLRDHGWLGITL